MPDAFVLMFPALVEILPALVEISEAKAPLIASLLTSAELLNAVIADALVLISPANSDLITFLCPSAEPDKVLIAELTSESVANVLSSDAVKISKALILPSWTPCSEAIELSRATLCVWAEPLNDVIAALLVPMLLALVAILDTLDAILDALVLALPSTVLMSPAKPDLSASLCTWADPLRLVTLDSIFVCLALEEVTYPANAWSLAVSTLLINVTISAKVSVSATDADKIASILPFSVPILPSKEDSIAFLWPSAELLNELTADDWAESNASLWVWAEPLNVVIAVPLLAILLALVLISEAKAPLIASLCEWADPDNVLTAEVTSASVAKVESNDAVNASILPNLPSWSSWTDTKPALIASLLISAEEDKAVIADALEEIPDALVAILLTLVEMLEAFVFAFPSTVLISEANPDLIDCLATSAEPLNVVTLVSMFVWRALEEVT